MDDEGEVCRSDGYPAMGRNDPTAPPIHPGGSENTLKTRVDSLLTDSLLYHVDSQKRIADMRDSFMARKLTSDLRVPL